MKILLLGDYPLDQHESLRRFAELLEREYRARGHEVRLLRPAPYLGRAKSASTGLLAPLGHLGYADKFVLFPPVLRRARG